MNARCRALEMPRRERFDTDRVINAFDKKVCVGNDAAGLDGRKIELPGFTRPEFQNFQIYGKRGYIGQCDRCGRGSGGRDTGD